MMSGELPPAVLPPRPPRRSRQDTVRANDQRIRQAMIEEIVAIGWDDVALTGIAKRAGLTVGALYARAETRAELGNLVWSAVVRDWLRDVLGEVVAAAHTGEPALLQRAFAELESTPGLPAAAVEFLIAAHFDDELDEVVGEDSRRIFSELRHLTPQDAGATAPPHLQAANVLLLAFALGRLMARRSAEDLPPLSAGQARALTAHATASGPGKQIPAGYPVHFVRDVPDLDPDLRSVVDAVLDVVGRVGYRRATIARMGRAAGMSGSSLSSRFTDKAHLVSYCALTRLVTPLDLWLNYAPAEEQFGPLLSRAMWVSDVLRVDNAPIWKLHLELARAAQVIAELVAFRPSPEPHLYANLGVMLVGSYSGDIHALPYDVPFQAGHAT